MLTAASCHRYYNLPHLLQASLAALAANPAHPELCRFYIHTMKSVSKRLVLRMYVNQKATLNIHHLAAWI